jgi:hypothetical protein
LKNDFQYGPLCLLLLLLLPEAATLLLLLLLLLLLKFQRAKVPNGPYQKQVQQKCEGKRMPLHC